ncbi:hypothetical protein WHI96_20065 [Pseudonocardia tropica]|uniref:Uncharacterized protein n=1 Tax=Pseudonocardia tropica TaxID=681289 RepID=A0ABV1K183_9PSEU
MTSTTPDPANHDDVEEKHGKLYRGDKVVRDDGTEEIVYTELPGDLTIRKIKQEGTDA